MMAENVVNEEFWLPADFLDDDYLLEEPTGNRRGSETESDEEYLIDGITRQMSRSFIHEEYGNPKVLATSPQSTLSGLRTSSFSSNNGSPDGPSKVSSPPSTPFTTNRDDALDLLYEAAGQVVRLGMNRDLGFLGPPRKPNRHHFRHNPSQTLIQEQLQAVQFYQLKREQLMKQQMPAVWRGQNGARSGASVGRPAGLSASAWPPLQPTRQHSQPQQNMPGAGMRAVFLNGSIPRRESSGTGVFLPRRAGAPLESRKKQACSTVLLPARVVQALNLNLDEIGVHPRFSGHQFVQDNGYIARNDVVHSKPRLDPVYHHHYHRPTVTATGPEIQLPQEWTY